MRPRQSRRGLFAMEIVMATPTGSPQPFRMHVEDPRFIGAVEKRLGEERNALAAQLVAGQVADWAAYQRLSGKIEGLDSALAVCAQERGNE